jgi:hypothetical protein
VYRLGGLTRYEDFLPTVPARRDPTGAVLDGEGRPVVAEYALVTCRTPIAGRRVAQAPRGALHLVRVDGPLVVRPRAGCTRREP